LIELYEERRKVTTTPATPDHELLPSRGWRGNLFIANHRIDGGVESGRRAATPVGGRIRKISKESPGIWDGCKKRPDVSKGDNDGFFNRRPLKRSRSRELRKLEKIRQKGSWGRAPSEKEGPLGGLQRKGQKLRAMSIAWGGSDC